MTTTDARPLKEVLYELSIAKDIPDSDLVDEFVKRYPEHASELTEFAVHIVFDALAASDSDDECPTTQDYDDEVAVAMSRFQNRLYAVEQEQGKQPEIQNPFATQDRTALRGLAKALRANNVFVMKLRDRQIEAQTMTDGFVAFVAKYLGVASDRLMAHFSAPPQLQAGTRFKAIGKPSVGERQTFEQAVRDSGLDADQQAYLLSL